MMLPLSSTEPQPTARATRAYAPDWPDAATTERDVLASFRRSPDAWLDVGHSRLAYRRFGTGPDLVLIHGWPLHSATFRRILPLLSDAFTCHLVDLPGVGQTQSDESAPVELGAYAATMRRAIDLLGLGRYAILAHDSGGFVARSLAAEDPRVAALALGNTEIPGHHPALVVALALASRLPGGTGLIRALISRRALRRSFLGFAGCFHDLAHLDGDFHEFFVAPLLESDAAARGQVRLLQTIDASLVRGLAAVHGRIRAPTRLIWGADDPFFPLPKAQAMLEQFAGGADLRVIPDAKLFVHEERPREFAEHARPFLLEALRAA